MASAPYAKWRNGNHTNFDRAIDCLRGVYCMLLEQDKEKYKKRRQKSLKKYDMTFYGAASPSIPKSDGSLKQETRVALNDWYRDKKNQWDQEGKIKKGRLVLA